MRVALTALFALAIGIVAAVRIHRAWTTPRLVQPQDEIILKESGATVAKVPAGSSETTSVVSWIREHPTGWKLSFITYAPHTTLSCDTFHLNIERHSLVLNYARRKGSSRWIQIVRDLSAEEQSFWESTIDRLRDVKQRR
jgi:hypothetical protein